MSAHVCWLNSDWSVLYFLSVLCKCDKKVDQSKWWGSYSGLRYLHVCGLIQDRSVSYFWSVFVQMREKSWSVIMVWDVCTCVLINSRHVLIKFRLIGTLMSAAMVGCHMVGCPTRWSLYLPLAFTIGSNVLVTIWLLVPKLVKFTSKDICSVYHALPKDIPEPWTSQIRNHL